MISGRLLLKGSKIVGKDRPFIHLSPSPPLLLDLREARLHNLLNNGSRQWRVEGELRLWPLYLLSL